MAQNQKQGAREVRLVFRTDGQNFVRTDIHWMDRFSNAMAQVQNTSAILEFVDSESGHILRRIELGEPTQEMRDLFDFEFGTEEVIGA
jgi:hypothetical protein